MINPLWIWVFFAGMAGLICLMIKLRKKHRLLYRIGVPFLVILVLCEGAWFALANARYSFKSSVGPDGTLVVIRYGRMIGPIWEIDEPAGHFVGHRMSLWLSDLGRSEGDGNNDYEGHFAGFEKPTRLWWENPDRLWIERYGSGAGEFVQRDAGGEWKLHCVNAGMRPLVTLP